MKKTIICLIVAATLLFHSNLSAQKQVRHRFMVACFSQGRVCIIGKDGKIEWECKIGNAVQDIWMLPNGNILVSYTQGVKEINKDKKVVWEYKTKQEGPLEIHSAQPLKNGNILICECGPKRLIEVNRSGKIVKEIKAETKKSCHLQFRSARKTKQGTYLVAFLGDSMIKELDESGKVLKKIHLAERDKSAHAVLELPNGNILATTAYSKGIKEFDCDGKLLWEVSKKDISDAGVKKVGYAAGIHRLPNGNTVLSMYHGDPQLIEITPDKKIIWSYFNKDLGNISSVNILDEEVISAQKEILR
jgi:antitoxin component YwqK of YwqJK toxin-antitoxin module